VRSPCAPLPPDPALAPLGRSTRSPARAPAGPATRTGNSSNRSKNRLKVTCPGERLGRSAAGHRPRGASVSRTCRPAVGSTRWLACLFLISEPFIRLGWKNQNSRAPLEYSLRTKVRHARRLENVLIRPFPESCADHPRCRLEFLDHASNGERSGTPGQRGSTTNRDAPPALPAVGLLSFHHVTTTLGNGANATPRRRRTTLQNR
jgi:hypothetical protein